MRVAASRGARRPCSLRREVGSGPCNGSSTREPPSTSLPGDVVAYAIEYLSPRGTYELDFLVQTRGRSKPLPANWELELEADPGPPIAAHGYIRDDTGIWTGSIGFTNASPETAVSGTATADSAIKVGAFASGDSATSPTPGGAIHGYSSRGPLLLGGDGVDVIAPTSSVAPAMPFDEKTQALPDASADDLVARLRAGARKDDVVVRAGPTVAGQGKLDVGRSLGVPPLTGEAPMVRLVVENDATREVTVRVDVTDDEPLDVLRARWDLDYDGEPDTGWEPSLRAPSSAPRSAHTLSASMFSTARATSRERPPASS